jgi:FG-GAP repeat protein
LSTRDPIRASRGWFAAALLLVCACGGSSGGSGGGPTPATLTQNLPPGTVVHSGELVEFTVESNHVRAASVTMSLLDPPPGCIFSQITQNQPKVTGRVRWLVPANLGGLRRLTFRAANDADPADVLFVSVDVRIDGPSSNVLLAVGDVTGDGIPDTVGVARLADVGGVADTGAVYVWNGKSAPAGAPDATLVVAGAVASDTLGNASGQGIQLADVTGDGVLDVIVPTTLASVGGLAQTGAIYVWQGGATLTGSPAPLATLAVAGAAAGDQLGLATGQGVQIADVTGDGILDLVAGAEFAEAGAVHDAGAVYVWKGGPTLAGTPAPVAVLTIPAAAADDRLGAALDQGIQIADVSGDGILDVIAASDVADFNSVVDSGIVCVWKGGATLSGTPSPDAVLAIPGATAADGLCHVSGRSLLLADVTGDGTLDLIAGTELADIAGVVDAGAVYVWAGGATLGGIQFPLATLTVPGAIAGDRLGLVSGQGMQVADVTGDGNLDLVVGAQFADVGGVVDTGAIYVWNGGPTLAATPPPLATLTVSGAVANDQLGASSGSGIELADVTGDGVADVVATAQLADVGGVVDAGALFVWRGGVTLIGGQAPFATLTVPGAIASNKLGFADNQAVQLADVTGDDQIDVVASAQDADIAGVVDVGAIYVWKGGATLSGGVSPLANLTVPGAVANDHLGQMSGQGIALADLDDDRVLDVIAGAYQADVGGVVDAGAVYLWKGGATLTGSPPLLATLAVPGAAASDRLGLSGGVAIQLVDVTADGAPDVVVSASQATVGGIVGTGALYVWDGSAALTGTPAPLATLTVAGAITLDHLGDSSGQGITLADVTGDGVADPLGIAFSADLGGVVDVGAIYLWQGGATLIGSPALLATLAVPGAVTGDQLGF